MPGRSSSSGGISQELSSKTSCGDPVRWVSPVASERVGQLPIVNPLIHQVAEQLKLRPVVPDDPMSPAMCERGTLTRRIFRQLANALKPVMQRSRHLE